MSKGSEFTFFKDEDKLIRAEFINSERKEVEDDVRFVFGIVIGILFTSFVLSLVQTEIIGNRVNRIIFALFMLFPLIILAVIWAWNQDYYFDALGVKLVLAVMVVLEFISTILYVIEVAGTGTTIPRPSNDTLAISLYFGLLIAITIGFVLVVYALIQTEEHPGIPLLKPKGEEMTEDTAVVNEKQEETHRRAETESEVIKGSTEHTISRPTKPTSRPKIIDELAKKPKSSGKSRKKTSSESKSKSKKKQTGAKTRKEKSQEKK